jgi:hypothetical protein
MAKPAAEISSAEHVHVQLHFGIRWLAGWFNNAAVRTMVIGIFVGWWLVVQDAGLLGSTQ